MASARQIVAGLVLALAALPALASYTFDGTNDQLKGVLATQRADPLTLACWVKTTTDSTQRVFLQIANGSGSQSDSYSIRTSASAQQYRATSIDNAAATSQATVSSNRDGAWVALIGVFNTDSDRTLHVDDGVTAATPVNNTQARTVVNTLNDISIGEGMDDANDVNGLIAECAIWVGELEQAEIDSYADGTLAPSVADTEALIGYWPMSTDTGGTVPNDGTDTGGDLNVSGNAAFNADHPPVGADPDFDAGFAKTADTTTSATLSYDANADADTLWSGFWLIGVTPTAAEIEAGTNDHGVATEAATGSPDSIVITTSDADPLATYGAHGVLEEGTSNYSPLSSLAVVLEPPADETYFAANVPWPGGEISIFENVSPAVVDDDYAHATLKADSFTAGPDAWDVVYAADGTFVIDDEGSPETCLTIARRVQDISVGGWSDATLKLLGVNCGVPAFVDLDPEAFPNGFLVEQNVAQSFPLADFWTHVHARPMTFNVNNLPTGGGEDGVNLDASFDTCGNYPTPQFEALDDLGSLTQQTLTIKVGATIPTVIGSSEAAATAAIEAKCSLNAVTGTGIYDAVVAVGLVAASTPSAGELVEHDQVVTLNLSLGPTPAGIGDRTTKTKRPRAPTIIH